MKFLRQSTAATVAVGPFLDKADGLTPLTAVADQSANGRLIKNGTGGAVTVASWAHDALGHYLVGLSTAHTDTLGRLRLGFSLPATYCPVWEDFMVLPAQVFDSIVAGTDALDVSLIEWLGVEPLALSSQRVQVVPTPDGIRQVTINVQAAGANIQGVFVAVYDAANAVLQTSGTTNSDGNVVVALNDATYKLRMAKQGYAFAVPETLVVTADQTSNYVATAWAPSAPISPSLCVVFGTIRDAGGNAVAGALVKAIDKVPEAVAGNQLSNATVSATTNASGYFELQLVRGATVQLIVQAAGIDATKLVPQAASQDLTTWV